MKRSVKRRAYRSNIRTAAVRRTRGAILRAARDLFLRCGYTGTTTSAIAERAGVALDTVYATVGRKAQLFTLLIETALSGTEEVVAGEQRDYVAEIRRAPSATEKLRIYAGAVGAIAPRLGPLHAILKEAAPAETDLALLWRSISTRRANNMRLFAQDLLATGDLRSDLTAERVGDIVWSMNGPEYYSMLVTERGWSNAEFAAWLFDAWCRLLLHRPVSGDGERLRPRSRRSDGARDDTAPDLPSAAS
jgi:AcrR family transcriptional regulator